jgi:hypothetical protein
MAEVLACIRYFRIANNTTALCSSYRYVDLGSVMIQPV